MQVSADQNTGPCLQAQVIPSCILTERTDQRKVVPDFRRITRYMYAAPYRDLVDRCFDPVVFIIYNVPAKVSRNNNTV